MVDVLADPGISDATLQIDTQLTSPLGSDMLLLQLLEQLLHASQRPVMVESGRAMFPDSSTETVDGATNVQGA